MCIRDRILRELESGNKGSEDLVDNARYNKVLLNETSSQESEEKLREKIRQELEKELKEELEKTIRKQLKAEEKSGKNYAKLQLDFDGDNEKFDEIKKQLESVNFLETTPMQAFNLLYELQRKISEDVK